MNPLGCTTEKKKLLRQKTEETKYYYVKDAVNLFAIHSNWITKLQSISNLINVSKLITRKTKYQYFL